MRYKTHLCWLLALICVTGAFAPEANGAKKRKKQQPEEDPYASYVWPPPPDQARIKLEAVITGRTDVEARDSKWKRALIGASPQVLYDKLNKPFAVDFDPEGRVLVTDWQSKAIIRFDSEDRRMDVLGTRGSVRLVQPMGIDVGPDGTIFVADAGQTQAVAYDPEGAVLQVYRGSGWLTNPVDVALAPDGKRLYVADSKGQRIVVFDRESGEPLEAFGSVGDDPGEFAFPTAVAFGPEGEIFIVDQLNQRVQLFSAEHEYVDHFGSLGVGFGNFVRPKDIAVDEIGMIYVTDFAFNNFQIFDLDFALLTFVGSGGTSPGKFSGISGIAVQGERIAVVDQLGKRLQLFRFVAPKSGE